jgi:tripartite-type tricarboxylate transporter receptor subunit TctC
MTVIVPRRRFLKLAAGAVALPTTSGLARAQAYPMRPVKVIVPFPPGGPTDVVARLVADKLTMTLGQPFVIENRPGGAGGTVGLRAVVNAEPDGYTLLVANVGTLTIAPSIYKGLIYDPRKSLTPIGLLTENPQVLAVNPSVAAATVAELVALAKANPGKVNFASPGAGTQPHLLGEQLKVVTGTNIVHVPYRGAAPAVTDLLSGQVQMYFESTSVLLPHIEARKVRAIAVTSAKRAMLLPQVPTVIEAGFPQLEATLWSGILTTAGVPPAIIAKLNATTNDVLGSDDVRTALANLGAVAKGGTSHEFATFIASEVAKWGEIVAAAGIKPE